MSRHNLPKLQARPKREKGDTAHEIWNNTHFPIYSREKKMRKCTSDTKVECKTLLLLLASFSSQFVLQIAIKNVSKEKCLGISFIFATGKSFLSRLERLPSPEKKNKHPGPILWAYFGKSAEALLNFHSGSTSCMPLNWALLQRFVRKCPVEFFLFFGKTIDPGETLFQSQNGS